MDVTVGDDFVGFCDQNVSVNMCPVVNGYGVMGAFIRSSLMQIV